MSYSVTDGVASVSGSGSINGGGTFSTTINLTGLADGSVIASATLTDAAGNISALGSMSVTKDTVLPAAPMECLQPPATSLRKFPRSASTAGWS